MKVVEISLLGSDREPLILELSPGMTAADILGEADLADYVLVRKSDPLNYISAEEPLYDKLIDCESLYALFAPGKCAY
jgi:hypothetical protein